MGHSDAYPFKPLKSCNVLWSSVLTFLIDAIGEMDFFKRVRFMDSGEDDGSFLPSEKALGSASWIGQIPFAVLGS